MKLTNKLALALAIIFAASQQSTAVSFSGSGTNPEVNANASGSATFSIAGSLLTSIHKNQTSPTTTAQGNAMTGIAFDIHSVSLVLTFACTAITARSEIWWSGGLSNMSDPWAGSSTDVLSPRDRHGVTA